MVCQAACARRLNFATNRGSTAKSLTRSRAETQRSASPIPRNFAPEVVTADYGYVRLRREDYTKEDVARWAAFVRQQTERWSDAFIYFKHEEAGIGPKLARQMMQALG